MKLKETDTIGLFEKTNQLENANPSSFSAEMVSL